MKQFFLFLLIAAAVALAQPNFISGEFLGRVTADSVTLNLVPEREVEAYVEYGTVAGASSNKTPTARYPAAEPFDVVLTNLNANTRYFYRVQVREAGASAFTPRTEHSFQTARPRGSTFTFALQFDPHMDENSDADTYKLTLANILAAKPDFLIDLGDVTMSDKLQPVTAAGVLDRTRLLRSFYDLLCHTVPLFQVLGNHEGEWGRNLNASGENVAIWNTLSRKKYFPNPAPGGNFFSSDSRAYPLVGQRHSYYAFEWGEALFVALDPYWNQTTAPDSGGDWSLTLGREQYEWLKRTLEASTATYKFVFAHNLVGGRDMNGPMRGGIETARYLEWGGYNLDGTWGFSKSRPGWAMPIHQLLVANNVTAFIHGHDHLYARQELDGLVYLEGPQPSARNVNLGTRGVDYAYTHGTVLGGTGYVLVTVTPESVKFDYVQTWLPSLVNTARTNGMIADTHTVPARRTNLKAASAASYGGGHVAPESIVVAFGEGFAQTVQVKDSAGVDRLAKVLSSASTQLSFVVPAETAAGRAQVTSGTAIGDILVDLVAPGIFTANADGAGVPAAMQLHIKPDGSQSSEPVFRCGAAAGSCTPAPIDLGSSNEQVYLSLYGTGIRNRTKLDDVTATIGGLNATVLYAGAQPDFPGLDQVNLQIPRSLTGRGDVPVVVSVAGRAANPVTINIR